MRIVIQKLLKYNIPSIYQFVGTKRISQFIESNSQILKEEMENYLQKGKKIYKIVSKIKYLFKWNIENQSFDPQTKQFFIFWFKILSDSTKDLKLNNDVLIDMYNNICFMLSENLESITDIKLEIFLNLLPN